MKKRNKIAAILLIVAVAMSVFGGNILAEAVPLNGTGYGTYLQYSNFNQENLTTNPSVITNDYTQAQQAIVAINNGGIGNGKRYYTLGPAGQHYIQATIHVATAGTYELRLGHTLGAQSNGATVSVNGGQAVTCSSPAAEPTNGEYWNSYGSFQFKTGTNTVRLTKTSTVGYLRFDTIRLYPEANNTLFTPSQNYTLSFYEEFDGNKLNTSEWNYRTGSKLGGINLPQNIRLQDSKLFIDFKYEDYDGDGTQEYTGGGIISKRNFGYGYYEVKAKLYGEGPGFHQSFWTAGAADAYDVANGITPALNTATEIDGFEVDSIRPSRPYQTVHDWSMGSEGHTAVSGGITPIDTTQWFTAGYEWLPGKVNFYYNGILSASVPFDEAYMPQTVWLSGLPTPEYEDWGGAAPPPAGAAMQVEYFKYYSTKVNAAISGNSSFEYQPVSSASTDTAATAQRPRGWIETGDDTASSVTQADARTGSCALQHSSSSDYSVTTKEILTNIPNGTYTLSAWVKSSGGQSQAIMKASGFGTADLTEQIPTTDTWTQISIPDIQVTNETLTIEFSSNASANQWILVDDVELIETPALTKSGSILIDNGGSGYTEMGTWQTSSVKGYQNSSTRYSTAVGDYAQWTPNIQSLQNYEIYLYKPVHTNSDTNAQVSIVHADGHSQQSIDFTQGTQGWYYLGTFPLQAGSYVRNTASAYASRADAVVFIPEDTKPVPTATPVPTPTPIPETAPITAQQGTDGNYYYKATKDTMSSNYTFTEYTDQCFTGTELGISLPAVRYYLSTPYPGNETWMAYRINVPTSGKYRIEFYTYHPMNGIAERTFSILNSNQTVFSNNTALTNDKTGWITLGEADLTAGTNLCKLSVFSPIYSSSFLRSDTIRLIPIDS